MEKAKQIARDFLSGDGKHKTTVDQDTRSAITHEHVRPETHEHVTAAIDKEVHQEHHQTRIQPVQATEVLPEKHTHNVLPVEHKTVEHGDKARERQTLEREAAKYKNTTTTHNTIRSATTDPTMTGERIHHHVHEHIQPVIEKETIQPHVIHTTAPVHETHHAAPVYHETTTLPTKTLDEFTQGAGKSALGAKASHTLREYEGCPQAYKESPGAQRLIHGGEGGFGTNSANYGENLTGSNIGGKKKTGAAYGENMAQTTGHEGHGTRGLGAGLAAGTGQITGKSGIITPVEGTWPVRNSSDSSTSSENLNYAKDPTTKAHKDKSTGLGNTAPQKKRRASLKDRLDPRKDADGDGKAGIFD